ncbi:MAG: dihydrofolate reductase family protein [Trueperaceae bacterium]
MRKVVAGLFITLDGVSEEPGNWQETFDDDMGVALQKGLDETGTILLGRVTYQYWEPYWPSDKVPAEDSGFATFINTTPKYIASRTLKDVKWGNFNNATLTSNLAADINKLKHQAGKNIGVMGSPTLVNELLQHDLLDELTLYVHNVVAYKGKRLFAEGNLKRMKLLEAKPTSSGVIIARYQPHKS